MNNTEALAVMRLVRALCPAQKLDELTPDAWALVMDDIGYEDARTAVRTIYRDQGDDREWNRKIEADDIIRQVKRHRTALVAASIANIDPPQEVANDPAAYLAWLRKTTKHLGDGHPAPPDTRGQLSARPPITVLTKGIGA